VQLTGAVFGAVVEYRGRPTKFLRDVESRGNRPAPIVSNQDSVDSAVQESGPGVWNLGCQCSLLSLSKAFQWPLAVLVSSFRRLDEYGWCCLIVCKLLRSGLELTEAGLRTEDNAVVVQVQGSPFTLRQSLGNLLAVPNDE
jgi:hypothetical protein